MCMNNWPELQQQHVEIVPSCVAATLAGWSFRDKNSTTSKYDAGPTDNWLVADGCFYETDPGRKKVVIVFGGRRNSGGTKMYLTRRPYVEPGGLPEAQNKSRTDGAACIEYHNPQWAQRPYKLRFATRRHHGKSQSE